MQAITTQRPALPEPCIARETLLEYDVIGGPYHGTKLVMPLGSFATLHFVAGPRELSKWDASARWVLGLLVQRWHGRYVKSYRGGKVPQWQNADGSQRVNMPRDDNKLAAYIWEDYK